MVAPDEAETTSLIEQIRAAFQDVRRGDGVSLHELRVLDDYGDEAARRAARAQDTDTHWWEVPDEDLLHLGSYCLYLDDRGWRYYLPAFMIHSLKIFHLPRMGRTDTRHYALEGLAYREQSELDRIDRKLELYWQQHNLPPLSPWPRQGSPGDRERQQWQTLTTAQNQAVCAYLRYVVAHEEDRHQIEDAEKGLRQHWGQFCGMNHATELERT